MIKKGQSLLQICEIAFAYVGTVVGAGFASGQELMQFFTMYGQNSIWAIIISALLFIYVGKQILLLGKEVRATSINSINIKVFGPISPIVTGYLILTMAVICTAMLAGSGALFQEYVGINGQIGILISALIAIVVMFLGLMVYYLQIRSLFLFCLLLIYLFLLLTEVLIFPRRI